MGWFRRARPPEFLPHSGHLAARDPSSHSESAPAVAPSDAFTPTQPKTGRRRLVGRDREFARIVQGLQEDHAHVVLYSERGRGKTSLANLVVEALRRSGTIVARHTCEAGTTFDSLMRGLMRDLPASFLAARAVPGSADMDQVGCSAALPHHPLRSIDILELPQRLDCRSLVCVIDEFDRVADPKTRTQIADLIKQLSDRGTKLQLLIVGVSDNLDQILGQHPSIQRAVIGVHLPLFSDYDIALLVSRASGELGITFPLEAMARIAVLARGMPYMVQLLGLRLTQAAKARGGDTVLKVDFRETVDRIIEDASPRVTALYADLTTHGRDTEMVLAVRRIARAPQDPWGRLSIAPTADGGVSVGGRVLSVAYWERLEAAQLLTPALVGSGQFVFAERGLMHHALLLETQAQLMESDAADVAILHEPRTPATRLAESRPTGRPPLAALRGQR